ncbi:MAG: hypothetical protein HY288_13420 [Planctomycetia bacterium]|nr:hypothetical protein [Planctomycetia bacterium]
MTVEQGEVSVGRRYAGILGLLAFLTIVMRGLVHGSGVESTLLAAAFHLVFFAFVGYLVGQLAGWIVLDSVRAKLAAIEQPQSSTVTTKR